MADVKYEKLDRIREDIKRDKAKVAKLQEQIKVKEAKLKEAEASQIVADVGAMNMTPEQLGGKRLIDRRRPQYKHPITECSTLDTFTSIFKLA